MRLVRGARPLGAALHRGCLGTTPAAEQVALRRLDTVIRLLAPGCAAVLSLYSQSVQLVAVCKAPVAAWLCTNTVQAQLGCAILGRPVSALHHCACMEPSLPAHLVPLAEGDCMPRHCQVLRWEHRHQLPDVLEPEAWEWVAVDGRPGCSSELSVQRAAGTPLLARWSSNPDTSEAPMPRRHTPSCVRPSRKGLICTKCSPARQASAGHW